MWWASKRGSRRAVALDAIGRGIVIIAWAVSPVEPGVKPACVMCRMLLRRDHTMRIVRFKDQEGRVRYGASYDGQTASLLEGDPFQGGLRDTGRRVDVARLLAP